MDLPSMKFAKSSNVRALGHAEGTLFVQYHSQSVYMFSGIALEQYTAALDSPSVGKAVISMTKGIKGTPWVPTAD